MIFDRVEAAQQDPILGLTEAFKRDPRERKLNLGVGVYRNGKGATPTLACVRAAEERILQQDREKTYLPIPGVLELAEVTQVLLLGAGHNLIRSGRVATAHTPGGSGALRVAAELIRRVEPRARMWVSNPAWANHIPVFRAAGLEVLQYPYFDETTHRRAPFERTLEALQAANSSDVVLFQASCHNPTGIDPSIEEWRALAALQQSRGFLPFFDTAYQGLGNGLDEDVASLRLFAEGVNELLIAGSYSKNLGLYNERVGTLSIVGATAEATTRAFGVAQSLIRTLYSTPSYHGGATAAHVLSDPALRSQWLEELAVMRTRIRQVRCAFAEAMASHGFGGVFSEVAKQNGLFSYLPIPRQKVEELKTQYGVYILDTGRTNVAGITDASLPWLCEAIAKVLR